MASVKKKSSKKSAKKQPGRPIGSKRKFKINLTASIREIIAKKNRFTTQKEICALLMKKVGKVRDNENEFAKKVSTLIYLDRQKKKLVSVVNGTDTRSHSYGLPNWMKNRKPLPAYAPKKVKA